MARIQDIDIPYLEFAEAAAPGTPASAISRIYAKADGLMYSKDDAGVETLMSSGAATGIAATILDAKGDLIAASAADTAAKLTVGANDTILIADSAQSTGLKWGVNRTTFMMGPWYINDLPGTATTQGLAMFMNTTTAVSVGSATQSDPLLGAAGKIVGLVMSSDNARTAGTATARVRVAGSGTAFNAGATLLDGTFTVRNGSFVAYASGVAFTSAQAIGVEVVTSGWTPTTANILVWAVVSLDLF